MKHIKLFEAFVNEKSGSVYGDAYTERGFNLMQKDLERLLNKYGFKYSIKDPKSKQVVYNINGTDVSTSITIYRNYGNYFGKFYLYMYSEKLKPKSQTTKLENKDKLDNILGQVAKTSNVMSPDQLALKKNLTLFIIYSSFDCLMAESKAASDLSQTLSSPTLFSGRSEYFSITFSKPKSL